MRTTVAAALTGLLAALAFAPAAGAQPYVVDFCKNWDTDAPLPVLPGMSAYAADGVVFNCHIGGAGAGAVNLLRAGGDLPPAGSAGLVLEIPADRPNLSMARVLTSYNAPGRSSGSRTFIRFLAGGTFLTDYESPHVAADNIALPAGTRRLQWDVFCSTSASTGCGWPSQTIFQLFKNRLYLDEAAAPSLTVSGGTLAVAGARSGQETVVVDTADGDSGVESVSVSLGTTVAGQLASACPRTDWSACPRALSEQTVTVDTSKVANGTYPVSVLARDAAGNATTRPAGSVLVHNGRGTGAANGAPATRLARLTARFRVTGKRTRRLRFRSSPTIAGRLLDEHKKPIAGAQIAVHARRRAAGARNLLIATATTRADGRWSHRLASGPSRRVTVSYTAFDGDARPADSVVLGTLVRAVLSANMPRSVRARSPIRMTGRLVHLPRAGVQILIYGRDGRVWKPFGRARTRRDGRFTWSYRFKARSAGSRFLIRAQVDSPIYPFAPGKSRSMLVNVR